VDVGHDDEEDDTYGKKIMIDKEHMMKTGKHLTEIETDPSLMNSQRMGRFGNDTNSDDRISYMNQLS